MKYIEKKMEIKYNVKIYSNEADFNKIKNCSGCIELQI